MKANGLPPCRRVLLSLPHARFATETWSPSSDSFPSPIIRSTTSMIVADAPLVVRLKPSSNLRTDGGMSSFRMPNDSDTTFSMTFSISSGAILSGFLEESGRSLRSLRGGFSHLR